MNKKLAPYALLNNVSKRLHVMLPDLIEDARHPAGIAGLGDISDMVLALKRCEEIINYMKRDVHNAYILMERLACIACTELNIAKRLEGEFSTATTKINFAMTLPKRKTDPEGYAKFLEYFGVSPELAENGLMKCDWPQMMEYLSNQQAMGKPLPPGVDGRRSYPIYGLRSALKSGIDDLEELLENEIGENDGEET